MSNEKERIAALELLLEAALKEIESLKAENAALKETIARLTRNSGNSSKPPSSDIVKPPIVRKRTGKRKTGAQKGHERHLRVPFEESHVDRTIDLTLTSCPKCGGVLSSTGEEPKNYQQVELVEKSFVVTEYVRHRYWCAFCQRYHETRVPEEVKRAGLFGQKLTALTGYMKGRCHMSYKTIQGFYGDALGLYVSTGFLVKQVGKVSDAVKTSYEQLVAHVPETGHIHSDETSHKEKGKSRWTWCLRGNDFTVFHIAASRSSAVLEELLGKEYRGVISSDFHSVYKKFKRTTNARLQLCWAHLIREVKYVQENGDKETSEWGKSLLKQIRKMFMSYHRRGEMREDTWERRMRVCKETILMIALTEVPERKAAQSLSARFEKWGEDYFRFIEEGLPPTNNLCEQSIRAVVIDRKITQGTRSDRGNRISERLWSIIATCEQRGENILSFMSSCVGAYLQGSSPPLLLVQ